jgi:hypothetical protein
VGNLLAAISMALYVYRTHPVLKRSLSIALIGEETDVPPGIRERR